MTTVHRNVRENTDQHHSKWYKSAVNLSEQLSSPSIPRRCSRQTKRENAPANIPEEYYRRTLTVPFIEHMLSHMEMHFTELQQKAVMALKIIPSFSSESTSGSENMESYAANLEDCFKMTCHLLQL